MRRLPFLLPLAAVLALLAGPALAAGAGLPVEEDFVRPPPPYEPPLPPPPVQPPPPPAFRPDFPPPRLLVAPAGPARQVMGAVCVVPETRRCDGGAGRVRTR